MKPQKQATDFRYFLGGPEPRRAATAGGGRLHRAVEFSDQPELCRPDLYLRCRQPGDAVNRDGRFGCWTYEMVRNPTDVAHGCCTDLPPARK